MAGSVQNFEGHFLLRHFLLRDVFIVLRSESFSWTLAEFWSQNLSVANHSHHFRAWHKEEPRRKEKRKEDVSFVYFSSQHRKQMICTTDSWHEIYIFSACHRCHVLFWYGQFAGTDNRIRRKACPGKAHPGASKFTSPQQMQQNGPFPVGKHTCICTALCTVEQKRKKKREQGKDESISHQPLHIRLQWCGPLVYRPKASCLSKVHGSPSSKFRAKNTLRWWVYWLQSMFRALLCSASCVSKHTYPISKILWCSRWIFALLFFGRRFVQARWSHLKHNVSEFVIHCHCSETMRFLAPVVAIEICRICFCFALNVYLRHNAAITACERASGWVMALGLLERLRKLQRRKREMCGEMGVILFRSQHQKENTCSSVLHFLLFHS